MRTVERSVCILLAACVLRCSAEAETSAKDASSPPQLTGAAGIGAGGSSVGNGGGNSVAMGGSPREAGTVDAIEAAFPSEASVEAEAASENLMEVTRALDKFQLLDPCDLTNYAVQPGLGSVCPQQNDVKNQHVSRQIAGDPNVTYDVTVRVRGIVEHYWYSGGMLDPVSKTFYLGGVPTVGGYSSACKNMASTLPFPLPAEITPTDGCFNGFNVFAMTVSAPAQHFYLNYTTDKDVDRPPHTVYQDDYTVTISIKGQAKLDFYVIGSDEHECYNHDKTIAGVSLPSSPYIGEFMQFDVVD